MTKTSTGCSILERESFDVHPLSAREILASEVILPVTVPAVMSAVCPHYQSDVRKCEVTGRTCENPRKYGNFKR